jgi:hypothetical protein
MDVFPRTSPPSEPPHIWSIASKNHPVRSLRTCSDATSDSARRSATADASAAVASNPRCLSMANAARACRISSVPASQSESFVVSGASGHRAIALTSVMRCALHSLLQVVWFFIHLSVNPSKPLALTRPCVFCVLCLGAGARMLTAAASLSCRCVAAASCASCSASCAARARSSAAVASAAAFSAAAWCRAHRASACRPCPGPRVQRCSGTGARRPVCRRRRS